MQLWRKSISSSGGSRLNPFLGLSTWAIVLRYFGERIFSSFKAQRRARSLNYVTRVGTLKDGKSRRPNYAKSIAQVLTVLLLSAGLPTAGYSAAPAKHHSSSYFPLVNQALHQKAEALSQSYDNSRIAITVDNIPDSLPVCDNAPAVRILSGADTGAQRVKLECDSPRRWSAYVRGTIRLFAPVLVARRPLSKGEVLSQHTWQFREYDLSKLRRGYITDSSQLNNMQLNKHISAGDVLTPRMLKPLTLVRRGDRIAIIARSSGFAISMQGEALENGALGQPIRVKNLSSGKVIRGTVSGNREVSVF